MAQAFKFRYVNKLAGGFVLLVFALVIAAVVVTARSQRWFALTRTIPISLPPEGSMGLRKGSDVMILGTVAGQVTSITVDSQTGAMHGEIRVLENFANLLRTNSEAWIRRTSLVAGDAYLDIDLTPRIRGRGRSATAPVDQPLPRDQTLRVRADLGPTELAEQLINQLRPAVGDLRIGIAQATQFLTSLNDPKGNLQQTLTSIANTSASIERGEGTIGKLLRDPQMAQNLQQTLARLSESVEQLQGVMADVRKSTAGLPELTANVSEQIKRMPELIAQTQGAIKQMEVILQDVQKTTSQMPKLVGGASQTIESMPGLVLQTQETLRQMQRLIEGFQRHWLVRGYVDQTQAPSRISPEAVGGAP